MTDFPHGTCFPATPPAALEGLAPHAPGSTSSRAPAPIRQVRPETMATCGARPSKRKADECGIEIAGRQVKPLKEGVVHRDAKMTVRTAPASGQMDRKDFVAVDQDEPCLCIPRKGSVPGLYSQGFDCCTAIILQSEDAIGLMHTSTPPAHLDVPIEAAIARFKTLGTSPPTITLGSNYSAILRSLRAGEAWEDHHDEALAATDRERYIKDNMHQFLSDIAGIASSFGARLVDLADGAVWVDVEGDIAGGKPVPHFFEDPAPR